MIAQPRRLRARCRGSRSAASHSCAAAAGSTVSGASSSATRSSSPAKAVIVATGSAALIPDIEGLRDARPWTNIEATTAKEVPPRLAVLGGGVVGVELSQAWSTLGSQVTLVHRGDRLIEREEPFASEQVRDGLARGRRRRPARSVRRQRHAQRRRHGRARRRHGARGRRGAGGLRPRARAPADIGLETIGLEAGGPLARRRRPPRARASTGCTRSATSTGASCSRTWGSTRGGSPPTRSSAARSSCARTAPARRA